MTPETKYSMLERLKHEGGGPTGCIYTNYNIYILSVEKLVKRTGCGGVVA